MNIKITYTHCLGLGLDYDLNVRKLKKISEKT